MKDCADVGRELGLDVTAGHYPKECCNSCHDDQHDTGEPLIITDDAEICCAILRLMGDAHGNEETQA